MKKNLQLLLITSLISLIISCTDTVDLNEIDTGDGNVNVAGDTLYIKVNPDWTGDSRGFNRPQDIMVGREPFIYVADTENDRIVMLNLNGQVLGARNIKHPVAIAQDYKLNLIVCAEFDTSSGTFSAVYKIDLASVSHQIEIAPIKKLLPRPVDLNRPQVEYTGACVFFNNTFYISRKGPNNNSFVDPDNSILIFSPKKLLGVHEDGDTLIGRVPNIDPLGQGLVSAYNISSMSSFKGQSIDILVTLTGENNLKAQWLEYVITPVDQRYQSNFSSSSVAFMIPNRFERPEGCTVDETGNIFIADAGKDSIYKFNSFGDELHSFGNFDKDSLNEPYGVAFFDKTLYVADTGNNRIVRFILSTDQ